MLEPQQEQNSYKCLKTQVKERILWYLYLCPSFVLCLYRGHGDLSGHISPVQNEYEMVLNMEANICILQGFYTSSL